MSRKIPNLSGVQRRCGVICCLRTDSKCKMSREIPNVSGVSTRFLRCRAHFGAWTPDSLMFLRDISILQRLKKRICEPCRSPTPDSFTFLRDILKNELGHGAGEHEKTHNKCKIPHTTKMCAHKQLLMRAQTRYRALLHRTNPTLHSLREPSTSLQRLKFRQWHFYK